MRVFGFARGGKCIDGIIFGIASIVVTMGASMLLLGATKSAGSTEEIVFYLVMNLFQLIAAAAYATWFIGKFGATPGTMACNIKVVNADGDKVTFGKALGRHFFEYLSWLIFGIGYLMSAFDAEKRSLHDGICSTRVVKG